VPSADAAQMADAQRAKKTSTFMVLCCRVAASLLRLLQVRVDDPRASAVERSKLAFVVRLASTGGIPLLIGVGVVSGMKAPCDET